MIKRARQSGQVANIIAKVVYSQDEFEYVIDENGEHLTHRPAFIDGDEVVKVYAFAKLNSGEIVIEVMSKTEVERVRDVTTKGKSSTAWEQWFDRMALKTVIHRLARRLPCASELFSLLEAHEGINLAENPLRMAMVANKRLSLRDVLRERTEKLRQKKEAVIETPPEVPPATSPKLEAVLIALDDATDKESLEEIVEHCKVLSAELSDAEKNTLREKMTTSKKRLHPPNKNSDAWMARLVNETGDGWRFPDGEIIYGFFEADRKARETGINFEKPDKCRFSTSH
ncbi:MAG: recombinase RecT [Candidatus Phlomobacter fragariae]